MASSLSATAETRRRPAAGLFRNSAFLLLWGAYGISAMGDHISELAVIKAMDALDSPYLMRLQAMIGFMFFLPYFFLGPFNGILADRLPRRGIMIFADLIRVAIMLSFSTLLAWCISFEDRIGDVAAFIPFAFVGIFAAMFSPARAALLPTLIRGDQLVRANAMISGLGVIASMISVAIGGYLAKHYMPQVAFTVDAVTFGFSALLLFFLRAPAQPRSATGIGSGFAELIEGVRYLRRHARVAQLIGVAVVVWSCGAAVRATIPTLVRDVYLPTIEGNDLFPYIGLFQLRLGLGMLAGALILSALSDALRSEIAITWSLAGIAGSIGLLAVTALVPMPARLAYHLGGTAIIFSGVFATGVMASYNALLQRIVPNRLRGRVFGLSDLVTIGGLLLATGLLGIPRWGNIDQWVGWVLLGVAVIVMATAGTSLLVRLRSKPFRMNVGFWWNINEFYCKWWFRLKREGICTVPAEGPVIVVANHTCSIDPLLLIASTPNRVLGFMIAEEYAKLPGAGRLIRMIGCVPVRRDGRDTTGTRTALRHLRDSNALGIFIEGRIRPPGEEIQPKDGAAMLALHSGAVVVPVHISGTRHDKNLAWSFFRRHNARVRFGKPIDLSKYWIPKADKDALGQLSQRLLQRIRELADEPAPEPTPGSPEGDPGL